MGMIPSLGSLQILKKLTTKNKIVGEHLRQPGISVKFNHNQPYMLSVFAKCAGVPDKIVCSAKTFSLSDKCPVNLSKENNILTTNMPSVQQILICPEKHYSLFDSCPASEEKILRRLCYLSFKTRSALITMLLCPALI